MSWRLEQPAGTVWSEYGLPETDEVITLIPPVEGPANWVLQTNDVIGIFTPSGVGVYYRCLYVRTLGSHVFLRVEDVHDDT